MKPAPCETGKGAWSARRTNPPPATFFVALMTRQEGYCEQAEDDLQEHLGPLLCRSDLYSFSCYSKYYDREMRGSVWKYFVGFRRPLPMDQLRKVKCLTETLEWKRSIASNVLSRNSSYRRSVNLDPGYVSAWNMVLTTVKNRAHRIYLGGGIFCEVALIFRSGAFQGMPWTYPDYLSSLSLDFFSRVRRHHVR